MWIGFYVATLIALGHSFRMALDANGNYYAALPDEQRGSLHGGLPVKSGAGVPDSSTPISLIYVDTETGAIYSNPSQTAGDWVSISSSGGAAQIKVGTGSPITGGISVVTYKVYIDETDAVNPSLWVVAQGAWTQLLN